MAAVAFYPDLDPEALPFQTAPTPKLQVCVLLIEDSEEAMWIVRMAVQDFGQGRYQLEWASNLREGLSQLKHGGIDIVLLDLGLPESSGAESFNSVHEIAPKTPVIVLTGDSRLETEKAVTAGGAEGFLVKDQVSGALLMQAIRAALYASKVRKPAQPLACS